MGSKPRPGLGGVHQAHRPTHWSCPRPQRMKGLRYCSRCSALLGSSVHGISATLVRKAKSKPLKFPHPLNEQDTQTWTFSWGTVRHYHHPEASEASQGSSEEWAGWHQCRGGWRPWWTDDRRGGGCSGVGAPQAQHRPQATVGSERPSGVWGLRDPPLLVTSEGLEAPFSCSLETSLLPPLILL